ncbi:hypothetical protein AKJ39_03460, partial [candidate division MSBL1 archaeon SCGC-AAA259J03]
MLKQMSIKDPEGLPFGAIDGEAIQRGKKRGNGEIRPQKKWSRGLISSFRCQNARRPVVNGFPPNQNLNLKTGRFFI